MKMQMQPKLDVWYGEHEVERKRRNVGSKFTVCVRSVVVGPPLGLHLKTFPSLYVNDIHRPVCSALCGFN